MEQYSFCMFIGALFVFVGHTSFCGDQRRENSQYTEKAEEEGFRKRGRGENDRISFA